MNKLQLLFISNLLKLPSVMAVALPMVFAAPAVTPPVQREKPPKSGRRIYLQQARVVPVKHAGPQDLTKAFSSGQAEPLSLASGDFDEDGIPDLLVGYSVPTVLGSGVVAVHRGNLDAFAPQSRQSFQAISLNHFPSPFLEKAQVIHVPARPDFLVAGQFSGKGHLDLLIGERGSNTLYVLAGDGRGAFFPSQPVTLPGSLTSLVAGDFGPGKQFTSLMIGVTAARPAVLVATGSPTGVLLSASLPLPAPATSLALGDLDGDSLPDAAIVAGGRVLVLHSASPPSEPKLETISLQLSANAVALGRFVFDRDPRLQMALLAADGSVHVAAHDGFDPRPLPPGQLNPLRGRPATSETWKLVENFSAVAPFRDASRPPILLRTRISSGGADDIMALNAETGRLVVISRPNTKASAGSFAPGEQSVRVYSAGSPVAALPMRVNVDGRTGLVVLHKGIVAPSVMSPLPDPTFTVNTTADTVDAHPGDGVCADSQGNCSLRAAIMEANADPGVDTIMLPAGIYTLSISGIDEDLGLTGDLDIRDGLNIVGIGPSTTIIQAGSSAATGIDNVLSINPNGLLHSFDTSLSNLTIRFGRNFSSITPYGGALNWDAGPMVPEI